jgi:hypothetical protein
MDQRHNGQSEYILSPSNKDKVPITSMQLASKQYPGFNSTQTMKGMKSISKMVMVVMMMLIEMLREMPPPKPRRSCDMIASIAPSPEAQDLPSPGVGEDFCLRRRLNISRENMA